jgi:hypothetical protein
MELIFRKKIKIYTTQMEFIFRKKLSTETQTESKTPKKVSWLQATAVN